MRIRPKRHNASSRLLIWSAVVFTILCFSWALRESCRSDGTLLSLGQISPRTAHVVGEEEPASAEAPPAPAAELGDLNVLLLGSDRRTEGDPSWRTDTIIVAAIRPKAGRIALFSIPRDLWITIPGHGANRINTADYLGEQQQGKGGGPALVAATLQESFGIPVHAYARINFKGLEKLIDALGGVTVTLERPIEDAVDDAHGGLQMRLPQGPNHLNGRQALLYADASRRNTNDLDRTRRQQQLLLAMRDAAARPAIILQLPKLLPALRGVVDTDLQIGEILSLATLALRVNPSSIRTRVFDETMISDWTTPGGAMVLLPNKARIVEAWQELVKP